MTGIWCSVYLAPCHHTSAVFQIHSTVTQFCLGKGIELEKPRRKVLCRCLSKAVSKDDDVFDEHDVQFFLQPTLRSFTGVESYFCTTCLYTP